MKITPTCDRPFLECLQGIHDSRFTGKFIAESDSGLTWTLYFGLGNLIWISGGLHPNRFMYREIKKAAPKLNLRSIFIPKPYESQCSHYYLLELLFNAKKIDEERLRAIVLSKFTEDFFDICQQEYLGRVSYTQEAKSREAMYEEGLRSSFITIRTAEICSDARRLWSEWRECGYSPWSPNRSPLLVQPEKLKEVVLAATFSNLVRLLDGTRSLRDLSFLMGQSLQRITASLSRHIKQGYVKLIEIQDLPLNLSDPSRNLLGDPVAKSPPITPVGSKRRLVICIDDSSQVRKVMGLILTQAGYDYIGIQHPLSAIPTLIKRVPDLIFLDLTMPLISGYELCDRIRKVSKLQNIPIVILTSNTGIVDRIRTRVLGVSRFITKPFDKAEIIATVEDVILSEKTPAAPASAVKA